MGTHPFLGALYTAWPSFPCFGWGGFGPSRGVLQWPRLVWWKPCTVRMEWNRSFLWYLTVAPTSLFGQVPSFLYGGGWNRFLPWLYWPPTCFLFVKSLCCCMEIGRDRFSYLDYTEPNLLLVGQVPLRLYGDRVEQVLALTTWPQQALCRSSVLAVIWG